MLKKLFIHEWTETCKLPALGLFSFAILTGIAALYYHFFPALTPEVEIHVGNLLLFIAYSFLAAALSLLILIYLGIRFYKNMYTDEGYLMHTLPVPAWMHLVSKMCNGMLWTYITGIVTTVTVLPVTALALPKIGYLSPGEFAELKETFSMLFGDNLWELLFYFIPYTLVSGLFAVLQLYAAVCLGQLFGKHKVFSSVICYLGLHALVSAVSSIFMVPALTGIIITKVPDSAVSAPTLVYPLLMDAVFLCGFFASLVLSVACFVLCHYLLKRNLNLD